MSASQNSGSSLASVIGSPDLGAGHAKKFAEFALLDDDETLARLHAKFWGRSITDEEQEWRTSQLAVESEIRNEHHQMDVDMMDDSEDILPGCCVLNIDVEGLELSKIWVRADYIRIYDFLETRHKVPAYERRAPGAVITGQPGIGKSIWVYYALRRRLAERKPVIWYREQSCYLFVEEGVYEVPHSFKPSYFHVFIWTLVDSDEAEESVPPHLVSRGTRLYVIYSTPPRSARWSRLHKTVRDITVIMNPWTRKEISYVASTYPPEIIDRNRVNHMYDLLGPIPRLCIDYSLDPVKLAQHEDGIQKAVSNITVNKLEEVFNDASSLDLDAFSHRICLIRRESRDNVASLPIVKVITPSIQSRLAAQFRTLGRSEQIRLYRHFAKVPDSRGIAGIFFEAASHRSLQDGMELKIIPMAHLPLMPAMPRPQWYSSHVLLRNKSLETSRQQALQKMLIIDIKASQPVEYTANGPSESIQPDVLYVPALSDQVGLDPFILVNGLLCIFQFTIDEDHDIKPGLIDFLATCPDLPSMDKWLFVLIIPPDQTLVCPQPYRLEMRKLQPYSTVISL